MSLALVWLILVILSVDNIGQFTIGFTGVIALLLREEKKTKANLISANIAILAGCGGLLACLSYTLMRWDTAVNIQIFTSKRFIILAIYMISLSILAAQKQTQPNNCKRKYKNDILALTTIICLNILLTLPFARQISPWNIQVILIYFSWNFSSSLMAILIAKNSSDTNRIVWAWLLSASTLLLVYGTHSRISGGVVGISTLLIISHNVEVKSSMAKTAAKISNLATTLTVYLFAFGLPIMTLLSPYINQTKPNIISKILFTLTGSRYQYHWSTNLFSSEGIGLRNLPIYPDNLMFLDNYNFYNEYLTEYYSSPWRNAQQINAGIGNAHSDPIQKLVDITINNPDNLLLPLFAIIITSYLVLRLVKTYQLIDSRNTQNSFYVYCACSNLLLISYLTTESISTWPTAMLLTSQLICLEQFKQIAGKEKAAATEKRNLKTTIVKCLKPTNQLMLALPYIFLFIIPSLMLITTKLIVA